MPAAPPLDIGAQCFDGSWSFWMDKWEAVPPTGKKTPILEKIGTFQSVSQFWRYFNNLPVLYFQDNDCSLHLFRAELTPTWEANPRGAQLKAWDYRAEALPYEDVWVRMCVAMLVEDFPHAKAISGCTATTDSFKLWLRDADDIEAKDAIVAYMDKHIATGIEHSFKSHKNMMQWAKIAAQKEEQQMQQKEGLHQRILSGSGAFTTQFASRGQSTAPRQNNLLSRGGDHHGRQLSSGSLGGSNRGHSKTSSMDSKSNHPNRRGSNGLQRHASAPEIGGDVESVDPHSRTMSAMSFTSDATVESCDAQSFVKKSRRGCRGGRRSRKRTSSGTMDEEAEMGVTSSVSPDPDTNPSEHLPAAAAAPSHDEELEEDGGNASDSSVVVHRERHNDAPQYAAAAAPHKLETDSDSGEPSSSSTPPLVEAIVDRKTALTSALKGVDPSRRVPSLSHVRQVSFQDSMTSPELLMAGVSPSQAANVSPTEDVPEMLTHSETKTFSPQMQPTGPDGEVAVKAPSQSPECRPCAEAVQKSPNDSIVESGAMRLPPQTVTKPVPAQLSRKQVLAQAGAKFNEQMDALEKKEQRSPNSGGTKHTMYTQNQMLIMFGSGVVATFGVIMVMSSMKDILGL